MKRGKSIFSILAAAIVLIALSSKPAQAGIRNYGLMAGTIPIIIITVGVLGSSFFAEPKKPTANVEPRVEVLPPIVISDASISASVKDLIAKLQPRFYETEVMGVADLNNPLSELNN